MRVAILSDIHGNLHALNRCIEDLASRGGADVLVAAGDLCMDGPKPRQVLERLRELGALALRGNTDRMVGLSDRSTLDPEDARAVTWVRKRIGREWAIWLAELPLTLPFGNGENGRLGLHPNPTTT